MIRISGLPIPGGRQLLTLLLTIVVAPGLCLAAPIGAGGHHTHGSMLTAQPDAMHGDSCAPEACCAMIAKVASKRPEELTAIVLEAGIPSTACPHDSRSIAPGPLASTPTDPPQRNLPLLC